LYLLHCFNYLSEVSKCDPLRSNVFSRKTEAIRPMCEKVELLHKVQSMIEDSFNRYLPPKRLALLTMKVSPSIRLLPYYSFNLRKYRGGMQQNRRYQGTMRVLKPERIQLSLFWKRETYEACNWVCKMLCQIPRIIESYFARLSFRSISSNGKRHQNSDLLSECALIE
jgi:hypothetical protein